METNQQDKTRNAEKTSDEHGDKIDRNGKSKIGSKIVEYQQQQEPDEGIKQYFPCDF